jgi:hypothetical protein
MQQVSDLRRMPHLPDISRGFKSLRHRHIYPRVCAGEDDFHSYDQRGGVFSAHILPTLFGEYAESRVIATASRSVSNRSA